LDELIVRAWEELTADRAVTCPVCGGDMNPEYGVQARPISGRCRDCGARLT
jgi:DNA-directed RNA polymerase subunit RPC12/RpoP